MRGKSLTISFGYRGLVRFAVSAVAFVGLGGCVWVGDLVGSGKSPPDEFVVVDKRPLVVPPDFQLRPPRPGVPSPQNIQPAAQVVDALFPGHTAVPPKPSAAEMALLDNFPQADADIRSTVGDDTALVNKGPMLSEILAMEPRAMESDGASIQRLTSDPR
ncbi:hypothetical protein JCM17845_00530 [Iodidimonas gelatinilytica]|uniref:DUF3035 domain-containing protein n=1 Tax=Iodidimonas gelatinilytica TaxID=1236966 RepID=A0A5A7MWZ0_9PROT|nr:hypothetical protein JCM17845_00530 [Iodidimonas gelatinilytica]